MGASDADVSEPTGVANGDRSIGGDAVLAGCGPSVGVADDGGPFLPAENSTHQSGTDTCFGGACGASRTRTDDLTDYESAALTN